MDKPLHSYNACRLGSIAVTVTPYGRAIARRCSRVTAAVTGICAGCVLMYILTAAVIAAGTWLPALVCAVVAGFFGWRCWPRTVKNRPADGNQQSGTKK